MDLFEVFPQLQDTTTELLHERSLRLIALSGLVYDEQSFYFELGTPRLWGRLAEGRVSIGVSAAKVRPERQSPPYRNLMRHLRRQWHCDVHLYAAGHAFVIGEQQEIAVLDDVAASSPYLFILTPPRLGGSRMPDALVQAVYLMPLEGWRGSQRPIDLLEVQREALNDFLAPKDWALSALRAAPWATLHVTSTLPDDARVRPVLALRGVQHLLRAEVIPEGLGLLEQGGGV